VLKVLPGANGANGAAGATGAKRCDKATGALLWEGELPLGPAGAPMTYLYRGKQYVVLAIGAGAQAELIAFAIK